MKFLQQQIQSLLVPIKFSQVLIKMIDFPSFIIQTKVQQAMEQRCVNHQNPSYGKWWLGYPKVQAKAQEKKTEDFTVRLRERKFPLIGFALSTATQTQLRCGQTNSGL